MLSDKLWDTFFDLLSFFIIVGLFLIAPAMQFLGVISADSECYEPKLVDVKHYTW